MTTTSGAFQRVDAGWGDNPPARGSLRPLLEDSRDGSSRDLPYRILLFLFAAIVAGVIGYYLVIIVYNAVPGWKLVGTKFFTSDQWNFGNGQYGALPVIVGTLLTTALALVIAVPAGVGGAVAIVFLIPRRIRFVVSTFVELLAVVPSIIYGLWGFLVISPWLDNHGEPFLKNLFHGNWPFNGVPIGVGLLLGMIVLGIMILPTVTAISRDVLVLVPKELIEGGLSLGATRGQVVRKVVLPSARIGLLGAITLGAARALGETIALFLVLGGVSVTHPIPTNFFSVLGTIATEIANNFGSYSGGLGVLCDLAMVLMVIVGTVNFTARFIIRRAERRLRP